MVLLKTIDFLTINSTTNTGTESSLLLFPDIEAEI